MRAFEGHDYDLAKEGYPCEQKACGALLVLGLRLSERTQVTATHILVAVHAQTLDLVDDSRALFIAFLSACLGDFAAHILKEVLRQTLGFRHGL
jgi:hypothetical protein